MKLQHGLAILSFLWCLNAHAAQSTSSTGNVAGDLGTVSAAIRGVASIKEICADSFPAYSKQNEAAYLEWRKKYLPFLQEMERYRRDSFMKQVNGNQAEYSERTIWWEKAIETNKQAIRQQFLAAGPENFRQRCQGYSASLQTDRVNLENFYAEQVATLRKTKSTLEDGSAAYKRGDYATALRLLRPLAQAGDAQVQATLGVMYDNGTGVTQDYQEALKWYRLAAAQGNSEAQFALGEMYRMGQGVRQDYAEAVKWYRLAAAQGRTSAQVNLGGMYDKGTGVTQDYQEAAKWYRLAAAKGDSQAQSNLGVMYEKGNGVTQDYTEALKWYRLAVEQADALAQHNLGTMYVSGQGVTQNFQEAAKLFRLAAAQGNALAQHNLGLMYSSGKGVTQDYKEAVKWYRLAAAQGLDSAQNNLGLMYVQGQGMEQDYVRAHMWFNLAAISGFANAVKGRDFVAAKMAPQQIAQAQEMARRCKASNYKQCN